MAEGGGGGNRKPATENRAPAVSENPASPLPVLLSDGQKTRRRRQLVSAPDGRAAPPDARSRHRRTKIRRRSDADNLRLDRLRRLGMGRRSLRRRPSSVQKAGLRNALRRSERLLRQIRPLLR